MLNLTDQEAARFWSKVEKTQTCWLWTGATSGSGYGRLNLRYRGTYAHRLSLEMSGVVVPDHHDVDHVCHNRLCVRPDHLRIATRSQNNQNRLGAQSNSKSGIRGVSLHRASGKWRVSVGHEGRVICGGLYEDIAEAEKAAIALRNELFTHNINDSREGNAA